MAITNTVTQQDCSIVKGQAIDPANPNGQISLDVLVDGIWDQAAYQTGFPAPHGWAGPMFKETYLDGKVHPITLRNKADGSTTSGGVYGPCWNTTASGYTLPQPGSPTTAVTTGAVTTVAPATSNVSSTMSTPFGNFSMTEILIGAAVLVGGFFLMQKR